MSESMNLWPYSERNAAEAYVAVETLAAEPELSLSEEDKKHMQVFARGLFEGGFEADVKLPSLDTVYKTSTVAATQTYYLHYFRTHEGKAALQKLKLGDDMNGNSLFRALAAGVATGEVPDSATRKAVANESRDWYKAELAARLTAKGGRPDAEYEDSPALAINYAPEKLLTKFEQLQAYRSFYRSVHGAISEEEITPFRQAQQVVLGIYIGRINNLTAELYPAVLQLAEQLRVSPSTERARDWQRRLFAAAPVIRRAFHDDTKDQRAFVDEFARRLDLVRNGAENVGQPDFSPIANEVQTLANELEAAPVEAAPESALALELVEKLAGTTWEAGQLKEFCEAVLADWQLLSQHQTSWEEAEERSGAAVDEHWQVVITPKVTSLTTDGAKKIVFVPKSFHRTLTQVSPAGALPATAHELAHVLQAEYDQEVAKQIPLAQIKGRRYVTGREMGGIYEERRMQSMLGQARLTNTTYLRALQVKLTGGNQTAAARAFMEASVRGAQVSDEVLRQKAETAGKNVLRLYRKKGFDSQPLDYIEQELLLRSMDRWPDEQVRAVAIGGGSFSLPDTAALHHIGLLELPAQINHHPAEDVMRIYLQKYEERKNL